MEDIQELGKVEATAWDIEGFYPTLPKSCIMEAMTGILKQVKQQHKIRGELLISIPKGNRKTPCKFGKNYKETNYNRKYFNKDTEYTTLNETVLVDVLEFCINNAVSMLQGTETSIMSKFACALQNAVFPLVHK